MLFRSEASLHDWHKKFAPPPVSCGDDATVAELRSEVKRLHKLLKRSKLEREILKKATAYFARESQWKYAWIQEHRDSYPVAAMCEALRVSPSGYFDSLDRKPNKQAQRHERIQQSVQQVHADSYGIYGSAKIADRLQQSDELESACRNTVATAMRELGFKSRVSKSFIRFTHTFQATNSGAGTRLSTLYRSMSTD